MEVKEMMEGKNLGDYLLIRCLGLGALGSAYLAQHRFLKRSFVVKVLDSELAHDSDFVNRFEREAAVLATLEHPNIVKVHNVSEAEGYYFLVTDPVVDEKGTATNLFEYSRQKGGRLPEDEIIRIIHQIASALDYTHEKGLAADPFAHRGLKPSNILISKKKEGASADFRFWAL
jgi:serine/threonine protein kinase